MNEMKHNNLTLHNAPKCSLDCDIELLLLLSAHELAFVGFYGGV